MAALLFAAGCGADEEGAKPDDITGLAGLSGLPGQIVLTWDLPDEAANIHQIKVNYYDHLTKQNALRVASIYANYIEIPNTRKRYGEYAFSVQTFSKDGVGGTVQEIKATSGAAARQCIGGDSTVVTLSRDNVSTNAEQADDGSLDALWDNTKSTYFHTVWKSGDWAATDDFLGDKHYLQVDLGAEKNVEYIRFYYMLRDHANTNHPTDIDVYGAAKEDVNDATKDDWFLIKKLVKVEDKLPISRAGAYTSPALTLGNPVRYIRFAVNATENGASANGTVYWSMSEFRIWYKAPEECYDPEVDEVD